MGSCLIWSVISVNNITAQPTLVSKLPAGSSFCFNLLFTVRSIYNDTQCMHIMSIHISSALCGWCFKRILFYTVTLSLLIAHYTRDIRTCSCERVGGYCVLWSTWFVCGIMGTTVPLASFLLRKTFPTFWQLQCPLQLLGAFINHHIVLYLTHQKVNEDFTNTLDDTGELETFWCW